MAVFVGGTAMDTTSLPIVLDNFADNDWKTIIWACQTGNVPDTWTVGSQKLMDIGVNEFAIDIIGLYHDDYADGSGKAPITFQMHDCYKKTFHASSHYNSSGWSGSYIRSNVVSEALGQMPRTVQGGIKKVNKLTSAGNKSDTIKTTEDTLFLLSEVEIFGSATNSKIGEGSQYAYYANGSSTIKTMDGNSCSWSTRSPYGDDTKSYCLVDVEGNSGYQEAGYSHGVSFAFCF